MTIKDLNRFIDAFNRTFGATTVNLWVKYQVDREKRRDFPEWGQPITEEDFEVLKPLLAGAVKTTTTVGGFSYVTEEQLIQYSFFTLNEEHYLVLSEEYRIRDILRLRDLLNNLGLFYKRVRLEDILTEPSEDKDESRRDKRP